MSTHYFSRWALATRPGIHTGCLAPCKTQRGITLIELMIAITLGLLLMVVISNLFLGSKQSYRSQDNLARLNENGRFAIELLEKNIREASFFAMSFVAPTAYATNSPVSFGIAPPAIAGVNNAGATGYCATCDSITTSWDSATDCLNTATPAGRAVNKFYVNTGNQLMCLGNGNATAQVLLDNVEDMQILYGERIRPNQRYLPAGTSGLDMERVDTVLLCILLRTADNGLAPQAQKYTTCSGTQVTATDRYIRRAFTVIVTMRNRSL